MCPQSSKFHYPASGLKAFYHKSLNMMLNLRLNKSTRLSSGDILRQVDQNSDAEHFSIIHTNVHTPMSNHFHNFLLAL